MSTKIVAIGDSLTQGFQSGSIFETSLSYPAMIARCLNDTSFKVPDFRGADGLPLNLEAILHLLAERYGDRINWLELIPALLTVHSFKDKVEDYWERGDGSRSSQTGPLHRNLAVWGFQLGDCYMLSEQVCRAYIPLPTNNNLQQIPEFAMYRTTRRTLNPSFTPRYEALTQVGVAKEIARDEGGIDNLLFWLGANHCLGSVVRLTIQESDEREIERLGHERTATLWKPKHFAAVLDRAAQEVAQIGAKHVFIANVPHVTIPPVSRGITPKAAPGEGRDEDGYFEFYTHFWIWDSDFSPGRHQYLTREQVRYIDRVIDEYNEMIENKAKVFGWHVVDICSVLDQLAFRRRKGTPSYLFPPGLVDALKANPATQERVTADREVILDTRYLRVEPQYDNPRQKYRGGLFSLDAIHPTAIGYGIVAYEFLKVMQQVWEDNGENVDLQPLDWKQVVAADSLLTNPPSNLASLQDTLGFLYGQTPLPKLLEIVSGLIM